jgi:hypothetical protein
MAINFYGILGPFDHRYIEAKLDPRIAATPDDFLSFTDKLVAERGPEANWPAITDEQLFTKH